MPSYETVLDECVIHRLAVPPQAKIAQLRLMIRTVSDEERITVRVLRHDAIVPGGFLPKSAFYLYTFTEPGDSPIAVIDTVTTDLVLPQQGEIARYAEIYNRLREAALSREDSMTFLDQVANRLADQTGSRT
ncbi:Scr1 family TA system antitoxin-like transcriptional regulator [Spirillospora sp. NPDC048823]|uniref:Scr1 family TA system antitoxin-like transcriptional regulator n=1 Tax=unclassified Spirillospora TaxID=2642701 RepID=UPI0037122CE2